MGRGKEKETLVYKRHTDWLSPAWHDRRLSKTEPRPFRPQADTNYWAQLARVASLLVILGDD